MSRYGGLTGTDLEHLPHNERPWQQTNSGRVQRSSSRIDLAVMASYFRESLADEDPSAPPVDAGELAALLSGAHARLSQQTAPDPVESLRSRLEGAR